MKKQATAFIRNNYKLLTVLAISIILNLSVLGIFTLKTINADSPTTVQACVDTNGALRLLKKNGSSCKTSETQITLSTGSGGGSSALNCVDCWPKDIMHRINQSALTNFNFDDAVLSGANLSNTDVSGSTFVSAVLYGVQFNGSTGVNVDFTNANLLSMTITDPADFTGAKFVNDDMTSSDLFNSNFTNADFTNVNFSHASLNGSTVTGANFTGVTWNDTTCPDSTNSDDDGNTCEGHLTP